MVGRDARINLLISTGHFLSHFYQLCLPPLFLVWQRQFDISFAELGLSVVLMTGTAAVLQTPVGFLVDRYGARPFLIGGALVMSIAIALMAFATAFGKSSSCRSSRASATPYSTRATTRSLPDRSVRNAWAAPSPCTASAAISVLRLRRRRSRRC
jgi:MFS family permease